MRKELLLILLALIINCGGGGDSPPASVTGSIPPTATTQPATGATPSSAFVHGSVNPHGQPATAWFRYGTDPGLAGARTTPAQSLGDGTSAVPVAAEVTALASNTTYYFRVEAENGSGTVCGNTLIFVTPPHTTLFKPYTMIPTGSWPEAVAIGDVNGDGRNDVVMTTSFDFDDPNDYKLFVFIQNPDGTLAAPVKYATRGTYTTPPETVAIGDLNGDGRNDVAVGLTGAGIEVFPQAPSGTLGAATFYATANSNKVRIADLNHDGRQDIVGIGWGTGSAVVFYQDGLGGFSSPATYGVLHGGYDDLEVADVNNDGLTDIVVMSGQLYVYNNIGILYQQPGGGFGTAVYYDVGGNELTRGVGVGDVDGDGRNDVVASFGGNRPSSSLAVFSQDNSGMLRLPATYASYDCPEPVEVADVNGDGRKDVLVLHGGWEAMGVYLQGSDGVLVPEQLFDIPYASHYNPHGLAVGDFNGDGRNDVAIADYNYGLVILYHSPP